MKKFILVPLALFALPLCAYESQTYYGNEFYAESTPAYTPPKPGQPTSTTYQSTPSTPIQNGTNPTPSPSSPSSSSSAHPYGPPAAPSSNYQRPASSSHPQPRTLPSHPYGPPGSGHLVDGSKNNNGNYPDDDKAETPYEKSDPQKGFTAVVNKPSISEDKTTIDSEVNGTQATERDRHKTENDRLLNRKIRHEINGGFEDSFPGVVLVTSDGLVVIEGTVPNIESHDKLERSISKIEGVKSVTNNTTVKAQR